MGLLYLTPIKSQPQGPTFTPGSLTGLKYWINAGSASSITQSSGSVSGWNDLSLTGANGSAAGAMRPLYSATAINGLPAVHFQGGNVMDCGTSQLIGTGGTGFTIWVVANQLSSQAFGFLYNFASGGSGNDCQFCFSTTGGYTNLFFGAKASGGTFGATRASTAFGSQNTPYAICLTYNGAGTYQFYSSNVSQTTVAGSDDTNTLTHNYLGAGAAGGGQGFNGYLAEMVIVDHAATLTERTNMETYFSRYGV